MLVRELPFASYLGRAEWRLLVSLSMVAYVVSLSVSCSGEDADVLELQTVPKPAPAIALYSTTDVEAFVRDLKRKQLVFPIAGVDPATVEGHFSQSRGGRIHHAVDILAARNTPVLAADSGKVARLMFSAAGGTTIYQFDPMEQYVYYYAHLEGYLAGLAEGDYLRKGQVIGYVGTSGNAPPNTPHLHFSISRLDPDKKWWKGTPIDPYEVFRR